MAAALAPGHCVPSFARAHGQQRDVAAITTIVVHTVGGPSCIGNRIVFRPIPYRSDDAVFWRDALRSAPVADAHIVIGRGGSVEQVIPVFEIANHTVGANATSIGIELVNRGDGVEPFEPAQIAKLIETIKALRRAFPKIALNDIVRHSDLDQRTCVCAGVIYRRRQDPGPRFPLAQIATAVGRPADPPYGDTTLPRLTGPASPAACPIF